MKRTVLVFILIFTHVALFSQTAVSLNNPLEHRGDSVTISGKVFGGAFLKHVKTQPTLLNLGDTISPKHRLMIRIDSGDRSKFAIAPEVMFLNKNITVSGVLDEYKGSALIKISEPGMIRVDSVPSDVSIADNASDNKTDVGKSRDTLFQYIPATLTSERSKNVRSQLVLRASPNNKAPVIAILDRGTVIVVPYLTKKWTYVYVKTENGTSKMFGFIKTKALKKLKQDH